MSQSILLDYKHKIGSHCASTAMRDILGHYGLELTEELCFGLGCGLNFVYWRSPVLFFLLQGRGNQLEKDICEFLGLHLDYFKTEDAGLGWELVRKYLNQNIPVIVEVDMGYLDYLRERFELIEGWRLGGHKVTVIGYEPDEEMVYLSDYAWQDFKKIPVSNLTKARSSFSNFAPPKNSLYAIYPFKKHRSLKTALQDAIRVNCHRMIYSWDRAIGIAAVKKFALEVTRWPRVMDEKRLKLNAFISHMMLEKIGTGGGAFRRIYSRFLKQAAGILNKKELNKSADEYMVLAKLWTSIAKLFGISSRFPGKGMFSGEKSVQDLLNEVAVREQEAIFNLKEYIDK